MLQIEQADRPKVKANLPAWHCTHCVAAVAAGEVEYLPTAHAMHAVKAEPVP